jgi:hypothetical protein
MGWGLKRKETDKAKKEGRKRGRKEESKAG